MPLLVQFDPAPQTGESNEGTSLQRFTSLIWLDDGLKKSVRVPDLFLRPPQVVLESKHFNFCVLFVAKKDAGVVTSSPSWRRKIVGMTFSPPFDLPQVAPPAPVAPAPPPRLSLLRRLADFVRRRLRRTSTSRRQTGAVSLFAHAVHYAMPTGGQAVGAASQSSKQMPKQGPSKRSAATDARPVAVAVLDEGIAFAHECFQSPAAPRIQFLWNQNTMVELTAADIQNEMALHPSGPDGENAVYRAIGGLDYSKDGYKPLARRRSHGTHVASIASKLAPGVPASKRPIIAVELPEQAVADPAGSNLYAYIVLGLFYAMVRVENDLSSGAVLPLVCNISYGPHHGPHDGTELFEQAVDALINLSRNSPWPLEVVLAAGNFRQSRVHAKVSASPGHDKSLQWRVQPQDLMPSFVELWCSFNDIGAISVTVTSPLGVSRFVDLSKPEDHEDDANGKPVFWMWIQPWDALSPPGRVAIVIALQPTATDPPLDATLPVAPSGLWTITVASQQNVISVEAWIGRKLGVGSRRGLVRQSYFDDPDYARFAVNTVPVDYDPAAPRGYVRRTETLSGISTGRLTHVVGASIGSTAAPTRYTSMGPVSGGGRTAPSPTLLATGDDSRVLHGVLAAGTRSGVVVSMNGSSVSAPQFAHWLAEEIATMPVIGVPFVPVYNPPVTAPPAGTPPFVAGLGCLVYPTTWYRVARPDRPTYC